MTIKKVIFQLHWFFGITAGLILAIMGVSGALYSYEETITKWINPATFQVQQQATATLTPSEIYQTLTQTFPDKKINNITVSSNKTESASVNFAVPNSRRGELHYINPYTAALLPAPRGEGFFDFVEHLHRWMAMGELAQLWSDDPSQWRDFGKQLTGASTLILIFFVLSGIYMRWPRKSTFREWFVVKSSLTGRSFLWSLHAVVGTWVLIFYLLLSLTGLYWSYDWYRTGLYYVMGVEQPQRGKAPPSAQAPGKKTDKPRREKAASNSMDVPQALTMSWQVFQQHTPHFSTASFKIPNPQSHSIDVNFFDLERAHERARNSMTINYQTRTVEKLALYEDKKLNEKIMSSILPVHRGSFFGSFWQFFTMLAALSMPLFFVTGWMLYLKRRKQKKRTQAEQNLAPIGDTDQQAWLVVYASQTGFAEQVAWRTAQNLQHAMIPAQVVALDKLKLEQLAQSEHALFVISTYGQGEAPDHARIFAKKIMAQNAQLTQLNYAVLALGDHEYTQTYCDFGKQVDQWLSASQAQALFPLITVNNGNAADLQQWQNALAATTHSTLDSMVVETIFDPWQITQRQLLNPDSLGEPAYEVRLSSAHDTDWHAGDIAEIQCGNSNAHIEQFIQAQQLDSAHTVQYKGQSMPLFDALRYLDLQADNITTNSAQAWVDQLSTLPSREYSIASIPQQGYVSLVIRQRQTADGLGLGSGWLTAHAPTDQPILLRIRSNESFHAPDDNRPLILIGNGTGIAGLLSILRYREQHGYACNWLIFGERQQQCDFFFQQDLQNWQATQHLYRLDLAFSRDQPQAVYVQHVLLQQRELLTQWVAQGASIYVCGSIDGMAPAVEKVLIDVLGEHTLEQLSSDERYKRDVY